MRKAGFTLIEMTLAMAILVIISVTVYQFTAVAIRAADLSMQVSAEQTTCGGLRRLVAEQLAEMPTNQSGALIGVNTSRRGGARHDALQLVCPAGNAVLTPDAKGYYQVTLDLREVPRGSDHWALGLERTPWTDDDDDDDDDAIKPGATVVQKSKEQLPTDWVRLMDNVSGLEIAYFDARLNGWVDKWTDQTALPNLVRLRVSLVGDSAPYEIVERVPGGGLSRNPMIVPPTVNGVNVPNVNGASVPNRNTSRAVP